MPEEQRPAPDSPEATVLWNLARDNGMSVARLTLPQTRPFLEMVRQVVPLPEKSDSEVAELVFVTTRALLNFARRDLLDQEFRAFVRADAEAIAAIGELFDLSDVAALTRHVQISGGTMPAKARLSEWEFRKTKAALWVSKTHARTVERTARKTWLQIYYSTLVQALKRTQNQLPSTDTDNPSQLGEGQPQTVNGGDTPSLGRLSSYLPRKKHEYASLTVAAMLAAALTATGFMLFGPSAAAPREPTYAQAIFAGGDPPTGDGGPAKVPGAPRVIEWTVDAAGPKPTTLTIKFRPENPSGGKPYSFGIGFENRRVGGIPGCDGLAATWKLTADGNAEIIGEGQMPFFDPGIDASVQTRPEVVKQEVTVSLTLTRSPVIPRDGAGIGNASCSNMTLLGHSPLFVTSSD